MSASVVTGTGLALADVDPTAVLGRRGLLYKDRATRLALCAARDALDDAGLLGVQGLTVAGESAAVVVSSNFGNLDTVCAVAATIAAETVARTSPMDLPNASSNVVASSLAIRFGLRGPNLMLCNGATGGLDAVYWADVLLRAGRAERVLVVEVETRNEVVERLVGSSEGLFDGAAALVVEDPAAARARGAEPLAAIGAYSRGSPRPSGALGVLQIATAVAAGGSA